MRGQEAFLGVVSDSSLSRVFFDEDEDADDIQVKDFEFGFKEHRIVVSGTAWLAFALFAGAIQLG